MPRLSAPSRRDCSPDSALAARSRRGGVASRHRCIAAVPAAVLALLLLAAPRPRRPDRGLDRHPHPRRFGFHPPGLRQFPSRRPVQQHLRPERRRLHPRIDKLHHHHFSPAGKRTPRARFCRRHPRAQRLHPDGWQQLLPLLRRLQLRQSRENLVQQRPQLDCRHRRNGQTRLGHHSHRPRRADELHSDGGRRGQ